MVSPFQIVRRAKTPTVLQQEATECGIAALAVILAYYGRHVRLSELRSVAGIGREGTDASMLLQLARHYGLSGKAYRKEPHELAQPGFPLIAHFRFVHYVVVEGMADGRVFLNDPESGPHEISVEEFDEDFTGIALGFEPTESFEKAGRPFHFPTALARRLASHGWALAMIAGTSLLRGGVVISTAILLQFCVDRCLAPGQAVGGVWPLVLTLGLVTAAGLLVTCLQDSQFRRLETTLSTRWTEACLDHVMRLPLSFFTSRIPRNIQTVIELNGASAEHLCNTLIPSFARLLALPILAAAMIWYDLTIGVTVVAFGALHLVVLSVVYCGRARAFRRLQHAQCGAGGLSPNILRNIESLKVGGGADSAFAVAAGQQARVLNAAQAFGAVAGVANVTAQLLGSLACVVILVLGAVNIAGGTLSIGGLVALYALELRFMAPLRSLIDTGEPVERLRQNLDRLDDVLAVPPQDTKGPKARPINANRVTARLAGHVQLHDICFGYSRHQPPQLHGLTLEINPGERVGILGPSGSGKSTLVRLMCGLQSPWSGHVCFDGQPVERVDRQVLANTVALVEHGTLLFDATVEGNVSLWRGDSAQDIVAALKDACIWDVVASRDGQTQSRLSPWDTQFSSGEIQRLQIARALVQKPSLIILDEATDALDLELERQILANLRHRGCGLLLIGQRRESMLGCDQVFHLEGGRLETVPIRAGCEHSTELECV